MKTCYICNIEFSLTSFVKDKQAKDGLSNACKSCWAKRSAEYRKKEPEKAKASVRACWETNRKAYYNSHNDNMLMKKYNLTRDQYNKLLDDTNGVCPICLSEFGDKAYTKPVVDHCHTTGKTRGIICRQCNIGLGAFKDNPISLEQAIKYLRVNNDY